MPHYIRKILLLSIILIVIFNKIFLSENFFLGAAENLSLLNLLRHDVNCVGTLGFPKCGPIASRDD